MKYATLKRNYTQSYKIDFKRAYFLSLFLLFFSLFSSVFSQSDGILNRPVPQRLVNDFSGIFEPQQAQRLEKMLVDYNDSTSTQITVVTVNSLNGYDIADYADRLAEKWGVGRRKKDNGVVILIKPKLSASGHGEVRISVGYGLEEVIPDAIAKRIVEQEMIPQFREGNYYRGVLAAVEVVVNLASGKYTAEQYEDDVNMTTVIVVVSIIIALFVFLLFFAKKSKFNNHDGTPPFIFFGGMGGFGKSGGGSKGGFGGFGGGSFGGGGAGGRW